jgi:hypothetical protein
LARARLRHVTFAELTKLESAAAHEEHEAPIVDSVHILKNSIGDGFAATR